jgi:hypothetical protein
MWSGSSQFLFLRIACMGRKYIIKEAYMHTILLGGEKIKGSHLKEVNLSLF